MSYDSDANLANIFPSSRGALQSLGEGELQIQLDADHLTNQELGRLLLLNGKRRAEGVRFTLRCPAALVRQLIELDLHRILWIEEA